MNESPQPQDKWSDYLERIANTRDRGAFVELFNHFAPQLKAFILSTSGVGDTTQFADELIQDVMLTIWRKATSFDRKKAAASTWIFTIARNRRIDLLRKQRHLPMQLQAEDLWEDSDSNEPLESLQQRTIQSRINDSLKTLPIEQRQVLAKVYIEGKSHREVAMELKMPLGTVKSRVRLGLGRLQLALHRYEL